MSSKMWSFESKGSRASVASIGSMLAGMRRLPVLGVRAA
jgi:hypothetical protein